MKLLTFTGQVILTVFCFAVLIALYVMVVDPAPTRVEWNTWLSAEEDSRLKKLHGVSVIEVGENAAYIERGGKKIIVKRRGETP